MLSKHLDAGPSTKRGQICFQVKTCSQHSESEINLNKICMCQVGAVDLR